MFVFNNRNKRWIGSMGAVLMGAAVVCAPMDTQASGALGSSGQIGISADLEAVEDTSVLEVAMNDIVISEFNLEGYSNLGIVTVSEGKVNIRETPSTDGKIVGKIGRDAGCDVLGEEGDWLHIKSGEVEGYIKAEYVLTGTDALQQASTLLKKVAKVTTDGLKVRTEPNTECEILDMVGSGQSFDVLEELDGWVRIDLDGETGYLSTDYVEVGSQLDEALTISELLYGEGVSNVRVAISDYAKQFIGNPYVWGGTSLTRRGLFRVRTFHLCPLRHQPAAFFQGAGELRYEDQHRRAASGRPGFLWKRFRYQPCGSLCGRRTGSARQQRARGHHDFQRELQNSGESGQTDSGLIAAIITERNTLRQDTSGVIFKDIRNCRRFFMRRKFLAINLF